MNADPLTYAPFLLLFLLAAAVEIRYWIRNRARMTPKARFRRGLFLAAVPVLCAALWLGRDRAAFWLEDHTEPPYARIEIPVADLRDDREGLRTFAGRLETTGWDGTHAEARARLDEAIVFIGLCALSSGSGKKGTVDDPLTMNDVRRAGITALFRTALENGRFRLSDILDRYAENKRNYPKMFSQMKAGGL